MQVFGIARLAGLTLTGLHRPPFAQPVLFNVEGEAPITAPPVSASGRKADSAIRRIRRPRLSPMP